MQWFKDLKIGTKLVAAFVVVGIITAIVGYMGITNMSKIDDMANQMYQKDTLGISYIKEANIDLIYVARDEKLLLLASTMAQREQYRQSLEENEAKLRQSTAKAKTLIYTAKGRELMNRFDQAWKDRQGVLNQTIALAMKDKLQKRRASVALAMGAGEQKSKVVDDLLTNLASVKDRQARNWAGTIPSTSQSTRRFMIIVVIGCVLLGLALGILISRTIAKPITQLVDVADRIAQGDVNQRIDYESKDELGSLADSFRGAVDYIKGVAGAAEPQPREVVFGPNSVAGQPPAASCPAIRDSSSLIPHGRATARRPPIGVFSPPDAWSAPAAWE